MKILVIGATGMLGNTLFRFLTDNSVSNEVLGTIRSSGNLNLFDDKYRNCLISNIDIENHDSLVNLLSNIRPDVVINCAGIIKQLKNASDPLPVISINAYYPHKLAKLCSLLDARLIHISTDCVFSGRKGGYKEEDECDASDLYGLSKNIGEVKYDNCLTIRTSMIGHELNSSNSLVDWFLHQEGQVNGYSKAIFSGLPTVELANVINSYILPDSDLHGLYHVSAEQISKFDLLNLVSKIYNKKITIINDENVVINRSLDSAKFKKITGYVPPDWEKLIISMKDFG